MSSVPSAPRSDWPPDGVPVPWGADGGPCRGVTVVPGTSRPSSPIPHPGAWAPLTAPPPDGKMLFIVLLIQSLSTYCVPHTGFSAKNENWKQYFWPHFNAPPQGWVALEPECFVLDAFLGNATHIFLHRGQGSPENVSSLFLSTAAFPWSSSALLCCFVFFMLSVVFVSSPFL